MSFPTFSEIGKPTKDLLSKDFPVGFSRLEINTSTPNDVKFTVLGAKDNASGNINSEVKTKYADKARGVTVTGAWTTADVLAADVQVKNALTKGLNVGLAGSVLTATGATTASLSADYRLPSFTFRSTTDVLKGPIVQADTSFTLGLNTVFGFETAFDVASKTIKRYNAVAGLIYPTYSVSINTTNDLERVAASYFHRVASNAEAGAQIVWNKNTSPSSIEFGTKAVIDPFTSVKAKINTKGIVGLSYTQILRPGVKFNAGANLDTASLSSAKNKVGLSVTIEA